MLYHFLSLSHSWNWQASRLNAVDRGPIIVRHCVSENIRSGTIFWRSELKGKSSRKYELSWLVSTFFRLPPCIGPPHFSIILRLSKHSHLNNECSFLHCALPLSPQRRLDWYLCAFLSHSSRSPSLIACLMPPNQSKMGVVLYSTENRAVHFSSYVSVPFSSTLKIFHWLIFRYMSCLLLFREEGRKWGKCFDAFKWFICRSVKWQTESYNFLTSIKAFKYDVIFKNSCLRISSIFSFAASIFPSSLGYSNWGSPANLYPPHSMSHVTSSHVSPHLGSYSHYAWPSHAPTANAHQVDNFELYKKLSPYE